MVKEGFMRSFRLVGAKIRSVREWVSFEMFKKFALKSFFIGRNPKSRKV